MPEPRKPTGDEFTALQSRYIETVAKMGQDSRVTGIDIGYLYDRGKRTDEIGVRVHMWPTGPVPAGDGDGAQTSAPLIANYVRGTPSINQNVRPANPIQPGISVSSERLRGGTIGLIVFDKTSGKPFVLSCTHVLGKKNADEPEWVIQPAMYLGGTATDPSHQLGHVLKSIDNFEGDAAIASIEARDFERSQFRSKVLIESADRPSLGDKVEKDGMGTRVRCGFVDGIGQYYMNGPGELAMNGFRIVRGTPGEDCDADLSEHADSGSVWYRKSDKKGLGLHVGGDISVADANVRPAIACYLDRVLELLEVRI